MARTLNETIHLVLSLTEAVAGCADLDELYEAVAFGAQLTYDLYPHIDCHTGCNRCCKDNSLPIVSPLEWTRLYQAIGAMPPEARQELAARALAGHAAMGAAYWDLHDGLQAPTSPEKFQALANVLERFGGSRCPFLVMETCSVYHDRPAKCRAHGAYLIKFGDSVQLHSCAEEIDKMELFLAEQGNRKIAMPFWNPVENRLFALNVPGRVSTILPLWLLAHVEGDTLAAAANSQPDWQAVKARYGPIR